MLDHIVGKPSANWKRTQAALTLLAGLWILRKGKTSQLPRPFQQFNHISAPEPLARLYKRSFYRATWILTALDAGFFTAMPLKPMWLRHICSVLFSFYYLVFADAAEEKVRRVRATISVEQMRVSWEKGATNPILACASRLLRPRFTIRKVLHIERPDYRRHLPPVEVYFYYTESPDTLAQHDTILLQFPGGGFVSMPPPCHEDALAAWAKQTGLPVCSVNYKKAPEYPYPWPIEECFDLYVALIESRGKLLGLSGDRDLNIIVTGDSAGGNVSAAVTLKIISHNQQLKAGFNDGSSYVMAGHEPVLGTPIPIPVGLILIYPALDFEMSCWMSPSQLSLIRAQSTTKLFRSGSLEGLWEAKDHFSHASPLSVVPDLDKPSLWQRVLGETSRKKRREGRAKPIGDRVHKFPQTDKNAWASSRLAMTSRMGFFNDRIIPPDLMRAMAIMYLGPHNYPDFESDYLLSPVVAPLELLAQFPKTYMMCGEKDPFVDDTVIFAGRIRQAKRQFHSNEDDVRVEFLQGISHAFLQMMAFLPEAPQAARAIGNWIQEMANGVSHSPIIESSTPITRHAVELMTNEKDMIHRRKQQIVDGLF
ncbi:hypothetical protein DFQ28_004882 [Apophysomyces sp. BC1034]|nr:hypothetical protein DFQ30_010111 [Apophysomyces sp. BC1015]KAG0178175.1 hypothetical protein DFQ29_003827 [Apophysomyces sp. BC1021]KAG0188421.1 hypothetical protein DFQ28_004882 [Apophysomyces sp. BC1034]